MGRKNKYLIEFRFFGKAKYQMKSLIREVRQKFHLGRRHRPVPHMTLAGPLRTSDEKRLKRDFKEICESYDKIEFVVEGYDVFEENNVVYIDINPSEELKSFRKELADRLSDYCELTEYDEMEEFDFHATIERKLPRKKFEKVKEYVNAKPDPDFKHTMIRATLLRGGKILREYDFMQERMLNRGKAKSRKVLNKTFDILHDYLEEKGEEVSELDKIPFQNANELIQPRNFVEKFLSFKRRRIFVSADQHLDHKNIIGYTDRPFDNVYEMNEILINAWNKQVREKDIVYFLGDLAYGRGSKPTHYWLKKLNGNLIFIEGNHDKSHKIRFYDKLIIDYKGQSLLLVHRPDDVPDDWDGWVIHGHKHNNDMENYPLFHAGNKTVNVGVELTDYEPLKLDTVVKWIEEAEDI